MNMKKFTSLLIIAAMLLSALPMAFAPATTINITPTYGPVYTEVVVSGTVATYNGHYEIRFDQDGDTITDYSYGNFTATGYAYSHEIEIQPSYAGGRWVEVIDWDSTDQPTVRDWFTVLTSLTIVSDHSQYVEGGPVTITATVNAAPATWNATFDPKIRVKAPSGATWNTTWTDVTFDLGEWVGVITSADPDTFFGEDGVYTAYLDWGLTGDYDDNLGAASTTFTVAILSADQYMRTEMVYFRVWIPSGVYVDYYEIVKSDGVVVRVQVNVNNTNAWYSGTYYIPKDAPLGTYTLRFHDSTDGVIYKSDTFLVIPASINVSTFVLPFYVPELMRTESQLVNITLRYPDGTYVLAGDLGAPPQVGVYYNTTHFASLTLDGYALAPYPVWFGVYKFPKNAPVGIGWGFNVTEDTLTDRYGNKGPASYASTLGDYPITINYAILKLDNWDDGNAPTLVYPTAGTSIERTLSTKARFRIIYPDTTLYTPSDLGTARVHVAQDYWDEYEWYVNYTATMSAADYNSSSGVWTATWKIPYNAPLGDYAYEFWTDDVVDPYDNYLPSTGSSDYFTVIPATITVTELTTNHPEYMSDDDLIVSFRALYPSGDPVINLEDGEYGPYIWVHFFDTNDEYVGEIPTTYNPSTQKYSGTWIVAQGHASGTWYAVVFEDAVEDDASPSNMGPEDDVETTFQVIRLSLTDIWRYLHEMNATYIQCCTDAKNAILQVQTTANTAVTEAQAAATAAQAAKTAADSALIASNTAITSANAAKTAADAAKTAADLATTAANTAGTKADAAKTAADAAKVAAQAATDANNSQNTLIYAAIGAALIAAIASIVALMQISRKIA
jgi:hypothetical protein